ncbi:MAG: CdaR family protein [Coprothermobacterota bacterium]|nr:CdaR family protein [Coprothermobacterota bacterium]
MRRILRALTSNGNLKLLSLLLALFLWVYVVTAEAPQLERVLPISVSVENLGEGLAVAQLPPTVSVRLRTPVRMEINPENLTAWVDLKGLGEGSWTIPVSVKPIPGATLMETRPDSVNLLVEKVETKTLTVEIVYFGQLPQGFTLGPSSTIEPATVSLKGSRSELQVAQRAVAPINLSQVRSQISQTAIVQVVDPEGITLTGQQAEPSTVNVSIPINLASLFKTVPIKADLRGALASGFLVKQVLVNPSIATLEGTIDSLDRVSSLFTLPIPLNGQSTDFLTWSNLDLTEFTGGALEVRLVDPGPVQVEIQVERSGQAQFEISIVAQGGSDGVRLVPPSVRILAGGPQSVIDSLSVADFTATVQVGGLSPGSYMLWVKVQPPPGVFLTQVATPTVEARIE